MKSITIHNLNEELATELENFAKIHRMSLNKSIKELLSRALGLDKKKKKYADYSDLCGIWTEAEEAGFHERIKDMEAVDESLWK